MSDTLRTDDTKVDVVTTGLAEALGGSDNASAHGAPLTRAFIFHPKPEKLRGLVRSLRNAHWLVIIWSHDDHVCP